MRTFSRTEIGALREIFREVGINFKGLNLTPIQIDELVANCKKHVIQVEISMNCIITSLETEGRKTSEQEEQSAYSDLARRRAHETVCLLIFKKDYSKCNIMEIIRSERIIRAIAEIF